MKKSFIKNSYWKDIILQTSGNTIAQVVGLIGMPILTRLYVPETFATQAIFIQLVTFLTAIISFRYEYFIQLLEDINQSHTLILWIAKIGLVMTTILTGGLIILDKSNILRQFDLTFSKYYYFAPITAYLISLSFAFKHEAERQEAFKATSIAEIVSKSSYIGAGISLAKILNGLGLILTTAFSAVGRLIYLRDYISSFISNIKNISSDKILVKIFAKRSIGLVSSNTILSISGLLPLIIISKQYGANNLGQFSLVMSTIFLPSGLIGSAVGNVFYQRTAKLWNSKDSDGLKKIWKDTILKLLLFAIPTYAVIYLISPWVYPLVFGDQWKLSGEIAQLMTIAAFFSFLAGPIDRISLVLGIGFYLPAIHLLRLAVIAVVSFLTIFESLNYLTFIIILSIGLSSVYILDILSGRFYFIARYTKQGFRHNT